MEKCASYIVGVSLSQSARTAVMQEPMSRGLVGRWLFVLVGGGNRTSTRAQHASTKSRSTQMMSTMTTSKKVPQHQHLYFLDDDDTTCSTTSNSDDDEDDDSSSSCEEIYGDCRSKLAADDISPHPSVSFATSLITDIHYRPRTLRQDKTVLYYCDADYRSFRRDAYREQQAKQKENNNDRQQAPAEGERCVRFQSQVVTKVWEYDYDRNDSLYWYSEAEIQEYVFPLCCVH
jgi:hypothetical protein